jgi:hypothetical protein
MFEDRVEGPVEYLPEPNGRRLVVATFSAFFVVIGWRTTLSGGTG